MDTEIIRFRRKKDDTDTMLAAKRMARGYCDFRIYGGTGSRRSFSREFAELAFFIAPGRARLALRQRLRRHAVTDGGVEFESARARSYLCSRRAEPPRELRSPA